MSDQSATQHTPTDSIEVYPKKSEEARAICLPRWANWIDGKRGQVDPCDNCPLYRPCIRGRDACAPGVEAFTRWIDGINRLAAEISHSAALAKAGTP